MERNGEVFSKLEIESAKSLLDSIVPLEPFRDKQHLFKGKNKIYDASFNGNLMKNGVYHKCKFINVNFKGTAGNNTVMENSILDNCIMENSNFKYSKFTNSILKINSLASTYDFSDFSGATIEDSSIVSSAFTECYFRNSKIIKSTIEHSEFKNSIFFNCIMKDIDLSKVTFDYSEFDEPKLDNVIFPFFGILNLVSGFSQIVDQENVFFKPSSSDYIVTNKQYIEEVRSLKPIFHNENNFLALSNIYTYDGEIENAYYTILAGLKYGCIYKNFTLIRNLCRFASINSYFSVKQLKEFYSYLDTFFKVQNMDYIEYHNYLNELALAKKMLIDCPFNRDIMEINLKANYDYMNDKKLAQTFKLINSILEEYAPSCNNYITLRHNSPPDITIIVSDNIYTLFLVFFALQLVFFKTLNGIEKIQNIIKNKNDIKLQKLNQELKKLEIEKKTTEAKSIKQKSDSILLPEDFKDISYLVSTYNDFPKELRKM